MTAIVFNCAYNGLNIIQELGRKGIEVYALDSFRNVGTVSRFAKYRSCSNPSTDEKGFIEELMNMGDDFEDRPVLIPTNDHWALAIARHRDKLNKFYNPCVSDEETVELLLDKEQFVRWGEKKGYPVPKCWNGKDVLEVGDNTFPIIAKRKDTTSTPDMMFRSKIATLYNHLFGKKKSREETISEKQKKLENLRLKVIKNKKQLESFIKKYDFILDDLVFQEYVRGMSDSMYTVGVYSNEGTVKGLFTGRKVRGYPPHIGDCKVGQCEVVPDHLIEVTKSICKDLDYHGIAEFEFKQDSDTGEYYLIEVNPRSWSWVGITPYCGVNLPWMAYKDLKGIENVGYREQNVTDGAVQWVKANEDLMNCLHYYEKLGFDKWNYSVSEWLEQMRTKKTVYADFSRDDLSPAIYAILLVIRRLITDPFGKQEG